MEKFGRLTRIEMNVVDAESEFGKLTENVAEDFEEGKELLPGDKALVSKVSGMGRGIVPGVVASLGFDELAEVVTQPIDVAEDGLNGSSGQVTRISCEVLSLKTAGECVDIGGRETIEETMNVFEKVAELSRAAFATGRIGMQKVGGLLVQFATSCAGT